MTIKLSEPIMLPAYYKSAQNATRKLGSLTLNEYGLDNTAVSIKAISNQKDKDLYLGLTWNFMNISGDQLVFAINYPNE